MLLDLVSRNRSYRRFYQEVTIASKTLLEFVELARLTATGSNKQSLKYIIINSNKENNLIFSCLSWAGYIPDWKCPIEGERPSAYIVILNDPKQKQDPKYDVGLACQSILLGAVEKELGGCMFGSVNRKQLREDFSIPAEYDITLVIALGKPKEIVQIDDIEGNDVRYWRDDKQVHHVPKRRIEDLIF